MPQHTTDSIKLPITVPPVKAAPERVIRLHGARQPASCPTCHGRLTGHVCLTCNKVRVPIQTRQVESAPAASPPADCTHRIVECISCHQRLNGETLLPFYPRGPNGGFMVEHRLWNDEFHTLEWFFNWEHPETGEIYSAMPAKLVLNVTDMAGILGVRPSWIFARSARWASRLAMYEVRVRTIDWMQEIYYDAANLDAAFGDDPAYARVRPETRAERRIKIRLQHFTSGCLHPETCKRQHKPPRPRGRR